MSQIRFVTRSWGRLVLIPNAGQVSAPNLEPELDGAQRERVAGALEHDAANARGTIWVKVEGSGVDRQRRPVTAGGPDVDGDDLGATTGLRTSGVGIKCVLGNDDH